MFRSSIPANSNRLKSVKLWLRSLWTSTFASTTVSTLTAESHLHYQSPLYLYFIQEVSIVTLYCLLGCRFLMRISRASKAVMVQSPVYPDTKYSAALFQVKNRSISKNYQLTNKIEHTLSYVGYDDIPTTRPWFQHLFLIYSVIWKSRNNQIFRLKCATFSYRLSAWDEVTMLPTNSINIGDLAKLCVILHQISVTKLPTTFPIMTIKISRTGLKQIFAVNKNIKKMGKNIS